MEKLFTILQDFYILIIADTIPDYVIIALNWMCFIAFSMILVIPVIVVFIFLKVLSPKRGGYYD